MAVSTLLCTLPSSTLPSGTELDSLSGIVDSRLTSSMFWAIESTDVTVSPNAYAYGINYDGTHRKTLRLIGINPAGPALYDAWADMCYDEINTTIWVANSGNPGHTGDTFWAYSFVEPASLGASGSVLDVTISGQYLFQWPDGGSGGWDCEAMMIDLGGQLYFVNKENSANTGLYQAPASLAPPPAVNTLTKVSSWSDVSSVTAADWASDNSAIYLTTQSDIDHGDAIYKYSTSDFSYLGKQAVPDAESGGGSPGQESALGFTANSSALLRGSAGLGAQVWSIDPNSNGAPATYTWRYSSSQLLTPKTHS